MNLQALDTKKGAHVSAFVTRLITPLYWSKCKFFYETLSVKHISILCFCSAMTNRLVLKVVF